MHNKKTVYSFFHTIILLILCSGISWGNVTIENPSSGTTLTGPINFSGYAEFGTGSGGGEIQVLISGGSHGKHTYNTDSAVWTYEDITGHLYDTGAVRYNGQYLLRVIARPNTGGESTADCLFYIDNTPEVVITTPASFTPETAIEVEGEFDFSGTIKFVEHLGGEEGQIRALMINGAQQIPKANRPVIYNEPDINWNFEEIVGSPLDAGALTNGLKKLSVQVLPYRQYSVIKDTYVKVDNTPVVTIDTPSEGAILGGPFEFSGTTVFKEHTGGVEGKIELMIDHVGPGTHGRMLDIEGENINWSYSAMNGHLVNGGNKTNGQHILKIQATAFNNASTGYIERPIIIDNTPELSISSPGDGDSVEGLFDVTGTAVFKENLTENDGKIEIWLNNVYKGYEWYNTTNVNWSYSNVVGNEINADNLNPGVNTIKVRASGQADPTVAFTEIEIKVYVCSKILSITADENPLMLGETTTLRAKVEDYSGWVYWDFVEEESDKDIQLYIVQGSETTAIIIATSGEGNAVIKGSTHPDMPDDCSKKIKVHIGCKKDGVAGSDDHNLSSINSSFVLGKAQDGLPAGTIVLKADTPSVENATPQILNLYSFLDTTQGIYDGDVLRQVVAPETFVDIFVIDAYSYRIDFYEPDAKVNLVNGVYEIGSGYDPFVSHIIENPDGASAFNRLRITKDTQGEIKVVEYAWDNTESTWSLSKGNGLQVIVQKEEVISGNEVKTKTIKDDTGIIASKTKKTYKEITCTGENTWNVLIEEVVDPDGEALTTTMTYFEEPSCPTGSCGLLETQVNPDGSWVRYEYNSEGRKTSEISSWLDAPVGSAASSAKAVYYDYTVQDTSDSEDAEDYYEPRLIEEKIEGHTVSKTIYVYQVDSVTGNRTIIEEKCTDPSAVYGDVTNLRTVKIKYNPGTDLAESGKIKSMQYPDGRLENYTYEHGTYTENGDPAQPGTFTGGTGSDIRTVIVYGTTSSPDGIAFKTIQEIIVQNEFGREQLKEKYVYSGNGYERIQWAVQIFDSFGHMTDVYKSDGTHSENEWINDGSCSCSLIGKKSETDATGIYTKYSYDDLNRIETITKEGTATQSDIITSYTYDGIDRKLTETISADGLSLLTTTAYDLVGRVDHVTDPAGLYTDYAYSSNGLVTTITRPGGTTKIVDHYIDGKTKSITGTGVVAKQYEYGVNADGTQWTKVYTGPSALASPAWESNTYDMLGRSVTAQKPGFTGTELIQYYYNDIGQRVKIVTSGMADTLYKYDDLGRQTRSGLDVNGNGILDLASMDRINEIESSYVQISTDWWKEAVQKVYATDNDTTAKTIGIRQTRLTGLGTGGLTSEIIDTDIHGNQVSAQITIDRTAKTVTQTIDYPDTTIDEVKVQENGLLVSATSKSGVNTTYSYDALGRQTGITDPRTGTFTTHYNTLGQVEYIEDPAGNQTSYTYDPTSGEKLTVTNALNKVTRYAYDGLGNVTHIWGDAAIPIRYEFEDYGRKHKMYTYQGGDSWNSSTWPTDTGLTEDETTWNYQEATGLLLSKLDDTGNGASYTYTSGGKMETRIWARESGSIVSIYSYDPDTGELLNVDYSDLTPDITISYNRSGNTKTVTDALGSRTLAYNDVFQVETETITGLYNKTITRTYETSGVVGRSTGFNLGPKYNVSYGYEPDTGRFNTVGWTVDGQTDTAAYSYVTGSDLIEQVAFGNGISLIYTYEPLRDLKSQVRNEYSGTIISQYDYINNAIGNRESVKTSGTAFAESMNNKFMNQSWFDDAVNGGTGIQIPQEYRSYDYDHIGNRKTSIDWDHGEQNFMDRTYTTNSLNQYGQIQLDQHSGSQSFMNMDYDDDGNINYLEIDGNVTIAAYNAENRLISVSPQTPTDGEQKYEYLYDYMGRRVQKEIYTYSESTETWDLTRQHLYIYDGWNMVCEIKTPSGQSAQNHYYVWGLDLSQSLQSAGGVGGLLTYVDDENDNMFNYLYDANGNVGQLLFANGGAIAVHYEYDPFGNLISGYGAYWINPYLFSSKYYDFETGLYYYGYRYHSPEFGRWLTRDPIEERGGINLYVNSNNNAISMFDILGHAAWKAKRISPHEKYKQRKRGYKSGYRWLLEVEGNAENDVVSASAEAHYGIGFIFSYLPNAVLRKQAMLFLVCDKKGKISYRADIIPGGRGSSEPEIDGDLLAKAFIDIDINNNIAKVKFSSAASFRKTITSGTYEESGGSVSVSGVGIESTSGESTEIGGLIGGYLPGEGKAEYKCVCE